MSLKIAIRRSVFETNSSSSHSVTISDEELSDFKALAKSELREGVIRAKLREGGYGWEWYRYYSPGAKIAYLVAQVTRGRRSGGSGQDITADVREYRDVDRMLSKIERATGCRVSVIGADRCPIDHDSVGVGIEVLSDEDAMMRFIFGQASYVETGNDNSSAPATIDTDCGPEPYHIGRYVEQPQSGVRVDLRIDPMGPVFVEPEGGEPIYAHVDGIEDFQGVWAALDGMFVEEVAVWSLRPPSFSASDAAEEVHEFAHEYLIELARRMPGMRIAKDLRVGSASDPAPKYIDEWTRKDSASYTLTSVVDEVKMGQLMEILGRHSGPSYR